MPTRAVNSFAAKEYSLLSEFHAPAAASSGPAPGPLLRSAEWISGGTAIQTGAVIAHLARSREAAWRGYLL
ncbi:hypothetical protein BN970_05225 [Mycolicibacterium conceptionense]|uniref:Uncharacterized protein n=1 Tax=Mycolicibacterium conceptionense TaxID=451644 RepID=A0A0U1DV13_9MYCO|nr:hypothetical protein BN970_05225 [Mycolicibacterium conceptionense]